MVKFAIVLIKNGKVHWYKKGYGTLHLANVEKEEMELMDAENGGNYEVVPERKLDILPMDENVERN